MSSIEDIPSGVSPMACEESTSRAAPCKGAGTAGQGVHGLRKGARTYGRVRVTRELQNSGVSVGEKRVGRLMREEGLRAKAAKKFKATTNSNHSQPIALNTLDRDFAATAPNQQWVGDITYIWTEKGCCIWRSLSTSFAARWWGGQYRAA